MVTLNFLWGITFENFINLFLINVLFKNSEKLIKVKTKASFYTQKISMFFMDIVFEENCIITLIRYTI
jgi:hypothetical protein